MMKPRLLVVELHHLGDAVLSVPFVRGAARTFEVHVLCRPAAEEIYRLCARPVKVHAWEPPWADEARAGALSVLKAVRSRGRALRAPQFDAAVCAWADARVSVLIAETRASRRVGFPMTRGNYYAADAPWRRRRLVAGRLIEAAWKISHPGVPLLTHPLHRASGAQPHLRCWEQLAEATGISCDCTVPWFEPAPPSGTVEEFCRDAHRRGQQVLAFHAEARLPSKQWPHERWKELIGSPAVSDRFAVMELIPPGAAPSGTAGAFSVQTPSVAVLISALAASDAVLCHDSLPAHLAAALGKPVVSIFGAGEPDWFAPWRNRERVVQQRVCPLHPCIDRCGMDQYVCLERISVGDVLRKVENFPRVP